MINQESDLSFGSLLELMLKNKGLSVKELSEQTKISSENIQRLLAEDFSNLPPHVFLRGFVKSICLVLEIDPAELLNKLQTMEDSPIGDIHYLKNKTHQKTRQMGRKKSTKGFKNKYLAFVLVLAVILVGAVWHVRSNLVLQKEKEIVVLEAATDLIKKVPSSSEPQTEPQTEPQKTQEEKIEPVESIQPAQPLETQENKNEVVENVKKLEIQAQEQVKLSILKNGVWEDLTLEQGNHFFDLTHVVELKVVQGEKLEILYNNIPIEFNSGIYPQRLSFFQDDEAKQAQNVN
jgi:cytoskeletal protein RodZ